MAFLTTVSEQQEMESKRLGAENYVKLKENEIVKIIPLVEFSEILAFQTHDFGEGKEFFSLPANSPEPGKPSTDPCLKIPLNKGDKPGLKHVVTSKYIMPVLLWKENDKKWSDPMYYIFKVTVCDGLVAAETPLKGSDYEKGIKGAVLQITRDDSTNRTTYSVAWTGQHWDKIGKGKELPISELDMLRGIIPFAYNDEKDINDGIILKLQERGLYNNGDKWDEKPTENEDVAF